MVNNMPRISAYTWEGCKKILRKHRLKTREFARWLEGQTCPILPSGKYGIYAYDLHRWIDYKIGKTNRIDWD